MTKPLTIAIVDDHGLFRSGLAALLGEFPELTISFEAANGRQLQENIKTHLLPDVVLMDINMPIMDGRKTTAWLKANYPEIRVLALSMFNAEKEVIAMLRAGAGGYLLKESSPSEVLHAIRTIHDQGIYLNELVSGKLLHAVIHDTPAAAFSNREMDFLRHCCTELTYKEIAAEMCVSIRTIDNYRDALFTKLGLRSRTGLVLYCLKNRLIILDE
ncbi:Oxygen regulatory protein NreC [compost metagenome]